MRFSKFYKAFLSFLLIVSAFIFKARVGIAADLDIVCGPGEGSTPENCHVESAEEPGVQNKQAPLFEGTVFPHYDLKPGDEFTRDLRVDNDRDEECNFSLLGGEISDDTEVLPGQYFSQRLIVEISDGVNTIGPISFYDLFNSIPLPLYLTTLAKDGEAGDIRTLAWTVTFDKNSGNEYQRAELDFDFDWSFECGESPMTVLFIGKENDKMGIKQKPGSEVTYTIRVSTRDDPVYNVYVLDLPPLGFTYRPGSWTSYSNKRGDLKGTITGEPTYHSPGKWFLGNMQAEEEVTLTYIADISLDQDPGEYPDLAFTGGTLYGDPSSQRVLGNESTGYFVGTNVLVYLEDTVVTETDVEEIEGGEVLGASTMPGTGSDTLTLCSFAFMGLVGFILSVAPTIKEHSA